MKKTYEEVLTFATLARKRLGQKTKLSHAVERVMKSYAKQAGELEAAYKERLADLDIEHCSVDDRGNIIERDTVDAQGKPTTAYVFTKEAQRARLKGQREALQALLKSEVEVEPYVATSLPEDLTDAEREAFAGFVLPAPAEEFEERIGVG